MDGLGKKWMVHKTQRTRAGASLGHPKTHIESEQNPWIPPHQHVKAVCPDSDPLIRPPHI